MRKEGRTVTVSYLGLAAFLVGADLAKLNSCGAEEGRNSLPGRRAGGQRERRQRRQPPTPHECGAGPRQHGLPRVLCISAQRWAAAGPLRAERPPARPGRPFGA